MDHIDILRKMPEAIFEILKEEKVLSTYRIPHIDIDKKSVETAVFNICGINSDQYEVYYIDTEGDLIMAAVEEDYSIAEQTLEGDLIVFRIQVKVDQQQLAFSQQFGEKEDKSFHEDNILEESRPQPEEEADNRNQAGFQHLKSQKADTSQQEEVKAKDQNEDSAAINGKQEELIEKSGEVSDKIQGQNVQKVDSLQGHLLEQAQQKVQSVAENGEQQECPEKREDVGDHLIQRQQNQSSDESSPLNNSDTNKSEKLVSSMSQKLLDINEQIAPPAQQDNNEKIQFAEAEGAVEVRDADIKLNQDNQLIQRLLNNPCLTEKLFDRLCQRLHTVLKEECFKPPQNNDQNVPQNELQIWTCSRCHNQISKLPCYMTQSNETICLECEQSIDQQELLVKVRSARQMQQIFAIKIVPVYKNELLFGQQKSQECAQLKKHSLELQRKVNEVAIRKIESEMKIQ